MTCERLEVAASEMTLGLIVPTDLARNAALALEDGCDSPSVRLLAALTNGDGHESKMLLDSAVAELGLPVLSKRDAAMRLAKEISKQVLAGTMRPYQGAKEIWEISLRVSGEHLPDLDSFVYAASEWEERPEDRPIFDEGIVIAARELSRK